MTDQRAQAEPGRSDFRRDTPHPADDAWQALDDALDAYEPPCRDRPLFTADSITVDQQALCESICGRCLVAELCDAYATASKFTVGFWAGHRYTQAGKQPAGPRKPTGRPKQAST